MFNIRLTWEIKALVRGSHGWPAVLVGTKQPSLLMPLLVALKADWGGTVLQFHGESLAVGLNKHARAQKLSETLSEVHTSGNCFSASCSSGLRSPS